jgi:hypothetical protein
MWLFELNGIGTYRTFMQTLIAVWLVLDLAKEVIKWLNKKNNSDPYDYLPWSKR